MSWCNVAHVRLLHAIVPLLSLACRCGTVVGIAICVARPCRGSIVGIRVSSSIRVPASLRIATSLLIASCSCGASWGGSVTLSLEDVSIGSVDEDNLTYSSEPSKPTRSE
jgi:hypothetical protein